MNTQFKILTALWIPLGILACGVLMQAYEIASNSVAKRSLVTITLLSALLMSLSSVVNISAMTTFQRIAGPRPTLDGQAYLFYNHSDDAKCVKWIQQNIKGTPVILEAHGDPYREYTRMSMNTGLPTILGWPYHVQQRGLASQDLEFRKNLVRLIYESKTLEEVTPALERFKIAYIAVGDIERQTYPGLAQEKFDNQEFFEKVFESGKTTLYRVKLFRTVPQGAS